MNTENRDEARTPAALNLREEFAPHSYQEWRQAAEELLKGVPFDKVLRTQTIEGITLEPLYRADDIADMASKAELPGLGGHARAGTADGYLRRGWDISQELPYGRPEEFNRAALLDLSRGQTELNIPLDLATRAGQDPDAAVAGRVGACGLSLSTLGDIERALRDVHLDMISTYFRCGSSGLPVSILLLALARKQGVDLAKLRGCVEVDPLGSLARLGKISVSIEAAYREMAILTRFAAENASGLQTIGVSGDPYHDGGASAVDELGFVIATAVEYVREMDKRGLGIDTVAPRMRFSLSIGSNFFMEIAKIRAARVLWAKVVEAFGGNDASKRIHIHGRSSIWNKSRLDAHTNLLRTTTESFSGVIGGVDSMHTSPFDEVLRVPDDFSRRIARNQQIILQEECELTRTIDPAGGSYYVEWLTDQVAQKAWAVFQDMEKLGGMWAALQQGAPQDKVSKTRDERLKRVQQRRDPIVGVNMYPNASEKKLDTRLPDYKALARERGLEIQNYRTGADAQTDNQVLTRLQELMAAEDDAVIEAGIACALAGASLGEISRTIRKGAADATSLPRNIPLARASQPFEQLREAAAAYADAQGHPPQILQANMGPSRFYRVRADWTASFFQAGGFEVLGDKDFATVDEAVSAATETGASIVVITSNDEKYAEVVAPLATALKALQNKPYVVVAGAPGESEAAWRAAGVDEFVNVRVNNHELNKKLLQKIGVL